MPSLVFFLRPVLGCDRLVSKAKVIENQVMAALFISISSDLSDERVRSFISRVILISSISVEVPIASKVGAAAVASPAGVPKLDTHSSSEVDPSKSSLPLVSVAPIVLPFLCLNDSKSDTEMDERHVSSTPHDAMLARWRSKVSSRPSSPTTSTPEIPTAPFHPYHLLLPCRALTVRKSVRPLPSHLLALRYTSHHLDRFTSGSSLDHLSSDHSSADHPLVDHTLDSHIHHLILYSPSHSVGPSRKRCRSFATTVPLSIPTSGALVPTRADLLLPHKRFKDSISPQDSIEEDIETNVLADIEADAMVVEVAANMDDEVGDKVEGEAEFSDREGRGHWNGTKRVRGEEFNSCRERSDLFNHVAALERSNVRLRGTLRKASARVDRSWRRMSFMAGELKQICRFRYYDRMRFRRLKTFTARRWDHNYHSLWYAPKVIKELVNQLVVKALATYEANCDVELVVESQSHNGDNGDNKNGGGNGNGNGGGNRDGNGGGNGNRNGGGNGNGNLNSNYKGSLRRWRQYFTSAIIQIGEAKTWLDELNEGTIEIIDVINEIFKEDFDAFLDEGSKILHFIEGTFLEEENFSEFVKFVAMIANENYNSESDTEEPPFEKITINTDYKIKTSLEEPPTNLKLKPLPDSLEYVFLEEPSFLLVIISSQLSTQNKSKLVSILKT
nr:reverse transcriptase domain-containing protein [Tanacetum cinerariifolium]